MPTRIIQYQCNKCHKVYFSEEKAIDCEKRHLKLNDFSILKINFEKTDTFFPRSLFIRSKKTFRIASYIFNHDEVKLKSFIDKEDF